MNKRSATASLCTVLGIMSMYFLPSCDKIKDAIKVNVVMQTANVSFSIPQQSVGTQTLSQFTATLNVDSILKKENSSLSADNIKSVKMKSCTIVLLNAEGNDNFGAFSAAKAELSSSANTSWATIADLGSNPDASSLSLTLPVNLSVELKDYFRSSNFTYRISGTTRRATGRALQCRATIQFDVQAGL